MQHKIHHHQARFWAYGLSLNLAETWLSRVPQAQASYGQEQACSDLPCEAHLSLESGMWVN